MHKYRFFKIRYVLQFIKGILILNNNNNNNNNNDDDNDNKNNKKKLIKACKMDKGDFRPATMGTNKYICTIKRTILILSDKRGP